MKNIIETFYNALNNKDAKAMCACYHADILFEDPAFGKLKGKRCKAMWQMLCESQMDKDFKVSFSNVRIDGNMGFAHWEAYYTFSKTGRKVHNKIDATFEFKDGLIIKHDDTFNLHNWAKQALGFKGFLLGGSGFFKKSLQQKTNSLLDKYIKKTT